MDKGKTKMNTDIFIAYYSWSGNTRKIAELIERKTGGTLFEIKPVQPYTTDYGDAVKQAKKGDPGRLSAGTEGLAGHRFLCGRVSGNPDLVAHHGAAIGFFHRRHRFERKDRCPVPYPRRRRRRFVRGGCRRNVPGCDNQRGPRHIQQRRPRDHG